MSLILIGHAPVPIRKEAVKYFKKNYPRIVVVALRSDEFQGDVLEADYDIAADVLDLLRIDLPDEDDELIWPEGDLDILADFGLTASELEVIAGEGDLYPDEQLQMVAQRCGFDEEFSKLLDTIFQ